MAEYDVLAVYEAPDDTTAAALAVAIGAGGATRSAKTTRLLSGAEWIDSLRKAQGSQYKAGAVTIGHAWSNLATPGSGPITASAASRSVQPPFLARPARLVPI